MSTEISLHIPFLHDGTRFRANPEPLRLVYPVGTGILVADTRCKFITAPDLIPGWRDPELNLEDHLHYMLYRLNHNNPYLIERGLLWPKIEYPCLTVDYDPTNPERGADLADYCAFWRMGSDGRDNVNFEYALWDTRMRAEGGGARDPNSTLGRLWPPPWAPKYVLSVKVQAEEEIVVVGDPGDEIIDPPVVNTNAIETPLVNPITLVSVTPMGTYQGDNGRQYREAF